MTTQSTTQPATQPATQLATQRRFAEYLARAGELASHAGLAQNAAAKAALASQIAAQELLVPVVGGFSAGKSTALNLFLDPAAQTDILPTAITPETALATELRYTEGESYAEGVKFVFNAASGKSTERTERLTLEQFAVLKERAADFDFARLHLNNPRLRDIAPLVLVDMPGFDAPNEEHNKAIAFYIKRGTHFIVLNDVKDGTIKDDIGRQLRKLRIHNRAFTFGLTKCDQRKPSDVNDVADQMQEDLESYDYDGEIHRLNRYGGLDKIIAEIKPNEIIANYYGGELAHDYNETQSFIKTQLEALQATAERAGDAIDELSGAVKKVERKKQTLIQDAAETAARAARETLGAIKFDLNAQMQEILDAINVSTEETHRVVGDIIQTTLLDEITRRTREQQERLVTAYKRELRGLDLAGFDVDSTWLDKIGVQIGDAIDDICNNGEPQDDGRFGGVLSALAEQTSAIAKNFINNVTQNLPIHPLLKDVLSVLSGFVGSFVNWLFGEKNAPKEKVAPQVVDYVVERLTQPVRDIYDEGFARLTGAIGECMEHKLNEKKAQIAAAQEQRAQEAQKTAAQIRILQETSEQLAALKAQYLQGE